ncbi:MAG: ShlB/FhaC/HecB family hemolysin secretion/activation protein [Planctomycetota bacterium]
MKHTRIEYRRPFAVGLGLLALLLAWANPAFAQDEAVDQPVVTQPTYPITDFKVQLDREVNPNDLDMVKLIRQPIALTQVDGVFTRPQPGTDTITTSLVKLESAEARQFDVTALRAIIDDLLLYLNEDENLVGIVVAPSPLDIAVDLTDRREGRTSLTILIRIASVGQVRTLASGDRIPQDNRENNPLHAPLITRSPLQAGDTPRTGSLIKRNQLDDYLYRLNRHPGRRVDAAISPGLNAGEVSLDYLVAENKPWYAYFQLSNTGTESTNELRERFGFVHNQVTNRDDIFSVDYITAGFDDSHVVTMGYRRPLDERWQLRFNALYSDFTADQVGSPLPFTGEDASFGASLAYNFYQGGPLFLDAVGGLEYYYTSANNPGAALEGEANLLLGSLGVELERVTDLAQTRGLIKFMGNLNEGDINDFNTLGRTAPDTQFLVMQYALTTSFYLEPLLNPDAWRDLSDPSTSTLAHEIALGVRGQWAVAGDRLLPTFQAVAGGLYSVRGYEQADVAADSSLIISAEYRFHLPRVFGIEAPRRTQLFDRPFRVAPEAVYGRPDWDLVFKAFVDYAFMDVTDELAFETDENLLGTGLGVEVALKNNVNFRAEWGFALQGAGRTDAGDSQFHFVLTLVY